MQRSLIKKGAEADIYMIEWYNRKAISKIRTPKQYRHAELDLAVRKQRTVHEASLMSAAKLAGVATPFMYFVDPARTEIVMEFVEGPSAKDALTTSLCNEMGRYSAILHANNIIHGDPTTSNFILSEKGLVLLDFGLAYYSERTEDMAVDIRLTKEVFTSAHIALEGAFESFAAGYASVAGEKRTAKLLENVREIEQRGRYARVA